MPPRRLLLPIVVLAGAVSCGGTADETTTPSPTADTTEASTVGSPTPRDVDPALGERVDAAVSDLADRLGVSADEITVVSAEMVTWGDTSLGCPQPGMRYAQVVTDGTRIVLEHDGTSHAYHSGGERRTPFLCQQPREPVDRTTPRIDPTLPTDDG